VASRARSKVGAGAGPLSESRLLSAIGADNTASGSRESVPQTNQLPRILVLVPHHPDRDPRIEWVTSICTQVAQVDVLGVAEGVDEGTKGDYSGARVECVGLGRSAGRSARAKALVTGALLRTGAQARHAKRAEGANSAGNAPSFLAEIDDRIADMTHLVATWGYHGMVWEALYRAAKDRPAPDLIVCHDLHALVPGVRLKKRFGSTLLYDSHEFWPDSDVGAGPLLRGAITRLERRSIKAADAVVTVSPQLAVRLENLYGLSGVLSVPNATPWRADQSPRVAGSPPRQVRFLFQGMAAPRRGLEELLIGWRRLRDPRGVLLLRSPSSPYFEKLIGDHQDLVNDGFLTILPPVDETQLVSAISADVGVIPYPPISLSHAYASPNKLSQFMHAGLAIMASDLEFVRQIIERYQCGAIYDSGNADSVAAVARGFLNAPRGLRAMREHALHAARTTFNWQTVSAPYREALVRLVSAGNVNQTDDRGRPLASVVPSR